MLLLLVVVLLVLLLLLVLVLLLLLLTPRCRTKGRLAEAIELTKSTLGLPDDYLVGIVPASDTGAYEMAMWSMLGPKHIDVCHWESFGKGWFADATNELGLGDNVSSLTLLSIPYVDPCC